MALGHVPVKLHARDDEAERLHELNLGFSRTEAHPPDPARDTHAHMLDALTAMRQLPAPPVLIANHPSRSAPGLGDCGANTPAGRKPTTRVARRLYPSDWERDGDHLVARQNAAHPIVLEPADPLTSLACR